MKLSDALEIPDARKIVAECLPLPDVLTMSEVSKATRLVFMSPPHPLPVNTITRNSPIPLPFGESFKCFDLQVNIPSSIINTIFLRGRWGFEGWGKKKGVFFIVKEDRKKAEDDGEGSGDIVCVCPINEKHEIIHLEFRPFRFGPGETYSLWAKIDSEGRGYKLDARDFTLCYLLYSNEEMDSNVSISSRHMVESSDILEPGRNDILCGKGNRAQYHPGNVFFRDLIKNYKLDYATTTKQQKMQFRRIIFDEIKRTKGRFLKLNLVTKRWSEIVEKEALMKIGQALREGAPEIKMALYNKQHLKLQKQGLGEETKSFETHDEDEVGMGMHRIYPSPSFNTVNVAKEKLSSITDQMAEADEKINQQKRKHLDLARNTEEFKKLRAASSESYKTDKVLSPQPQARSNTSNIRSEDEDDSETADINHNAMSILAQVAGSTLQNKTSSSNSSKVSVTNADQLRIDLAQRVIIELSDKLQGEPSIDHSSPSRTNPLHHKQTELRVKFGKRRYRFLLREELVRTTTNQLEFTENSETDSNSKPTSAINGRSTRTEAAPLENNNTKKMKASFNFGNGTRVFHRAIGVEKAKILAEDSGLRELHLFNSTISGEEARALAKSSHLINLRLLRCKITVEGAIALARSSHLTNLTLSGIDIGDEMAAAFASSSHLQNLTIIGGRITVDGTRALSTSSHLTNLVLADEINLGIARSLASSSHLRNLTIIGGRINVDAARALVGSSHLTSLTLCGGDIDGDMGNAISSGSHITNLTLIGVSISVDGAKALVKSSHFMKLAIYGGEVSHEVTAVLVSSPNLNSLEIDHNDKESITNGFKAAGINLEVLHINIDDVFR